MSREQPSLTRHLLVWTLGGNHKTVRYEARQWGWRESLVVGTAVFPVLLLLIPWPFLDQSSLAYSPYPQIALPPFNAAIGLALLLLAVPGVIRDVKRDT